MAFDNVCRVVENGVEVWYVGVQLERELSLSGSLDQLAVDLENPFLVHFVDVSFTVLV